MKIIKFVEVESTSCHLFLAFSLLCFVFYCEVSMSFTSS